MTKKASIKLEHKIVGGREAIEATIYGPHLADVVKLLGLTIDTYPEFKEAVILALEISADIKSEKNPNIN